ncbi:hypothetical protein EPN52_15080 [bacterium]|nr:MAG: hypothetical protein EPN52_15080 [bacterium]
MSNFARVLRNAANLGTAEAAGRAVGFVRTVVLARVLHAAGYGTFAAAMAFGVLLAALAEAGLSYFTAREVARAPHAARRLVWTAYVLHAALCVAALALGLAVLPLFRFSGQEALAAMLLLAGACADGMTGQALALFRGRQRMGVEARVVTFGRFVLLIGVIAVAVFAPTVLWAAAVTAVGSALTAAIALTVAALAERPVRPKRRELAAVARAALPFAASGLLSMIYFRVDVLLLRMLGIADAPIGAYSAAYRVMEAPRSAPGVVASGFFPEAARLAREGDRGRLLSLGARSLTLVVAAVVPLSVAFVSAPAFITRTLFGVDFSGSAELLRILAPMPVLMAMNAIAIALVNASGGQRRVVTIFSVCTAVNVGANLLLIPLLGVTGAAIATVLTEAVELVAFVLWIRANFGALRAPLTGVAVAGATALAAAAFVPGAQGLWRIVVATAAYLGVLVPLLLIARRGVAAV